MKNPSAALNEVVRNHFEGYTRAESETLLKAFHSDTRLLTVDDGMLERTEMSEWIENIDRRKTNGDFRTGTYQIVSSEESADAAVATVMLTFPNLEFTDHLSLLRVGGELKIVGKTYTVR